MKHRRSFLKKPCAFLLVASCLAFFGISGARMAHADGLAPILESAAGQYFMRELGLGIELNAGEALAADLERVRAISAASEQELFAPGTARALTQAEESSLRSAFIEQGREVREFLNLSERTRSYSDNRTRFLADPPLPKGKSVVFESQRPDLIDGWIYRIEISRGNARLGQFVDRFEQGAIDDLLRKYPRELEAWGVRVIEHLPGSTVIEVPDIDALNARVRLRGYGFQFEMAAGQEPVPARQYLEALARGRIPIAPFGPLGEDARMFTHDLLVHAIAISAFMPASVVTSVTAQATELLSLYAEPAVQASAQMRARVLELMRVRVNLFDQRTGEIMVIAAFPPALRAERFVEHFSRY